MITNTEIRNALTGALAIMALGLFVSCSDNLVAPADDALDVHPQLGVLVQDPVQGCSMVEGLWVCSPVGSGLVTSDSGPQHCEFIQGVLHCEPVEGD
jgi:hypothetical protein